MRNPTVANYRVIKPGWYFNGNCNWGRQGSAGCPGRSLGCLWKAPAPHADGWLWLWDASALPSRKGCASQLPRKPEHPQLWVAESLADGGHLENLESPPAVRQRGAGFFTCGEPFGWAWQSEWCQPPWADKYPIAMWGVTPFWKRDLFKRWTSHSHLLMDSACKETTFTLQVTNDNGSLSAFFSQLDVLQVLASASLLNIALDWGYVCLLRLLWGWCLPYYHSHICDNLLQVSYRHSASEEVLKENLNETYCSENGWLQGHCYCLSVK